MVLSKCIANNNEIKYAIDIIPMNLDIFSCADYIEYSICRLLVNPLIERDSKQLFRHSYGLEEIKALNDEMGFSIRIKANMYWDDGSVVTAYDYVNGIRRLNQSICPISNMFSPIKNWEEASCGEVEISDLGIMAINCNELIVLLDSPMDYIETILSTIYFSPYKCCEEDGKQLYCGPFCIKEFDEKKIILEKNKFYRTGSDISSIEYIFVDDMKMAIKEYENGKIAITCNTAFPYADVELYRKYEDFHESKESGLFFILHCNNNLLKKYISSIIDRTEIANELYNCITPVYSMCSKSKSEKKDNISVDYEPHKKKLKLLYSNYYPNGIVANIIKEQIEKDKIIEIDLVCLNLDILSEKIDAMDYDLALSITYQCFSGIIPAFYNYMGILNDNMLDKSIQLLEQYYNGGQLDEAKLDAIVNDGLPFIPLFEIGSFQFINPQLQGLTIDSQGIISISPNGENKGI